MNTIVWLLSSVGEHVSVQSTFLAKGFVAYGTQVCFFLCVGEQVFLQIIKLHKRFLTDFAFVCFFFRVSCHVILHASISSKRLVADFTIVWLCPSVSELVLIEIFTSGEGLVALLAFDRGAFVLLLVSKNVFLQPTRDCIRFVALVTFVRLLSGVGGHVCPQVLG